ncbi:unnamed protein product [Trypanosoma congolense IL3000]|uniref:WGS project CAEQ00000000 data, annotated contig 2244 n=1 Tax=Trypanosoma congolense (strain IL3000) TaxID=1068625 RepID=F9WCL3_TRYCI|nr:unnamed protein product [Trypanosoma congolense IL3000]
MAKNTFNQVIFGKNGKEDLSHEALEVVPSRMAACGSKPLEKKGQSAGKNLIVDFFCLCAKHDVEDGVDKVCGVSVGNGRDSRWEGGTLDSANTMWDEVKNGCEKFFKNGVTSTQDGYSLYNDFLEKVKVGGNVKLKHSSTVHKPGMLGTAVSETEKNDFHCNGKKEVNNGRFNVGSGSGVCVSYGNHHREQNIKWLSQFKAGLQLVDQLNTETASWQHQLTTLLNRARELYEKVKADTQQEEVDTDESPLTQHPNPEENENTDSATRSMRHSLLAWALLLQ